MFEQSLYPYKFFVTDEVMDKYSQLLNLPFDGDISLAIPKEGFLGSNIFIDSFVGIEPNTSEPEKKPSDGSED